jgi:hypothetical protein
MVFSFCTVIWAIIMLEFWKRLEKKTALEWGMVGFESNEATRPGIVMYCDVFTRSLYAIYCTDYTYAFTAAHH